MVIKPHFATLDWSWESVDSRILKLQCCLFIYYTCEHRQVEGTDEFFFYIDELFPNIAFLTS